MYSILYYVVGFADDVRHAVTTDPHRWVRDAPEEPMSALCGCELLVALPGDDRAPPAPQLPDGSNVFCPGCTMHDAAGGQHHRVLTTQGWRMHAALNPPHQPRTWTGAPMPAD